MKNKEKEMSEAKRDNYGDDEDIDTSVAEQILDEMNKLEANQ